MKLYTHIVAVGILALQAMETTTAGFVTTSGTAFEVDGEPFYVFGTNAYWASEIDWSEDNLATIFDTMAKNDLTVCRTMGFADVTTVGTAPYDIYYQLWADGNATINTGDTGLGYFDLVVAAAKAAGVKLVVPLVNNWSDYGGMDVYVQQLGGTYHDDFYTDDTVIAAYKNYVKTFVSRYADDETIMAWELCNECRCAGSGTLSESGSCTTTTITDWMTEMSAYIKTLDSNHLVATGSEGFMNTDSSVYLYSGPSGVDFDANLAIDSIDYGTYHAYPDSWGVDESAYESWGVQWIQDHAASGVTAGKPVVMEEYGVKTLNASIYQAWSDAVYAEKSNMQYWQFGVSSLSTADDGYTIYDTDELFTTVIAPAAEEFAALSATSTNSTSSTTTATTSASTASVAGDASTADEAASTTSTEASAVDASAATADESTASSTEAASTTTTSSSDASSDTTTTTGSTSTTTTASTASSTAASSTGSSTTSTTSTAPSSDASSDSTTTTGSSTTSTTATSTTSSSTTDESATTAAPTTSTSTGATSDKCSVRRRV